MLQPYRRTDQMLKGGKNTVQACNPAMKDETMEVEDTDVGLLESMCFAYTRSPNISQVPVSSGMAHALSQSFFSRRLMNKKILYPSCYHVW